MAKTNFNHDVFYVHERYARRMASRRFVGGMVLGALIMFTAPIYKGWKECCQCAAKSWKERHGYSEPEASDEVESATCDESDFLYSKM